MCGKLISFSLFDRSIVFFLILSSININQRVECWSLFWENVYWLAGFGIGMNFRCAVQLMHMVWQSCTLLCMNFRCAVQLISRFSTGIFRYSSWVKATTASKISGAMCNFAISCAWVAPRIWNSYRYQIQLVSKHFLSKYVTTFSILRDHDRSFQENRRSLSCFLLPMEFSMFSNPWLWLLSYQPRHCLRLRIRLSSYSWSTPFLLECWYFVRFFSFSRSWLTRILWGWWFSEQSLLFLAFFVGLKYQRGHLLVWSRYFLYCVCFDL